MSVPVDTEPVGPAKVIGVVKVPSLAESTQLAAWYGPDPLLHAS